MNIFQSQKTLQNYSYLRDVVHKACPGVRGQCKIGAFRILNSWEAFCATWQLLKQHCAFGFWLSFP